VSALTQPAPLWRRLAAALYDALLLAALWLLVVMLDTAARALAQLAYDPHVLRGLLFATGALFFGGFWAHGGQTLGMRAWRLRLRRADGRPLSWPDALLRYALAWVAWLPLGAGVLWCAIDSRRRAWHDTWTGTEVVVVPADAG
jgi:uncharacterized RDD family membrane protein YckC